MLGAMHTRSSADSACVASQLGAHRWVPAGWAAGRTAVFAELPRVSCQQTVLVDWQWWASTVIRCVLLAAALAWAGKLVEPCRGTAYACVHRLSQAAADKRLRTRKRAARLQLAMGTTGKTAEL